MVVVVLDSAVKFDYNKHALSGPGPKLWLRRGLGQALPPFSRWEEAYHTCRLVQKGRPFWTAPLAAVDDAADLFGRNASNRYQRIRPVTIYPADLLRNPF